MALRIVRAPRIETTPDPHLLVKTHIYAQLQPQHPAFRFDVVRLDPDTTIDFEVSFSEQLWPDAPRLFASFPGVLLKPEYSGVGQFELFDQFVFKTVQRYICDHLGAGAHKEREQLQLIKDWQIDDRAVDEYVLSLMQNTPFGYSGLLATAPEMIGMLRAHIEQENCIIAVFRMHTDTLNQQVGDVEAKHGLDRAEAMLKKYITEAVVKALYFCEVASIEDANHAKIQLATNSALSAEDCAHA